MDPWCVCIYSYSCVGGGELYITCLNCYMMLFSCYVFYGYAVFHSEFINVCIAL
jgi:hypothetical protein